MIQNTINNYLRIILVGTTQPGNIGGAMRAMKNMGLSTLYLVEPSAFPSDRAVWRAAGAADLLEHVMVCESLDEALQNCQLIIGTSARSRRVSWPIESPDATAKRVITAVGQQQQCAILFGREDSGLTNDELQRCHWHVHIPSNPEYSSLNLCSAVQVICYEIRKQVLANTGAVYSNEWDTPLATHSEMEHFYQHLESTMIATDFHDADNPKQTLTRMRRLFQRIHPDINEIQILRGFLTAINKYQNE